MPLSRATRQRQGSRPLRRWQRWGEPPRWQRPSRRRAPASRENADGAGEAHDLGDLRRAVAARDPTLDQADANDVRAEARVQRQKDVVLELKRAGRATAAAEQLLWTFQEVMLACAEILLTAQIRHRREQRGKGEAGQAGQPSGETSA